MVGAQAAVVGAAPLHRRVVALRHLRVLEEHLAAAAVVVDVVGDQHALGAVHRAVLEHQHAAVLEDDLGVDAPVAGRADRDRGVVEQIRSCLGHRATSSGDRINRAMRDAKQLTGPDRQAPTPKDERAAAQSRTATGSERQSTSMVIAQPPQPPIARTGAGQAHEQRLPDARPGLGESPPPQPEHQQREGAGGERHTDHEQERPQRRSPRAGATPRRGTRRTSRRPGRRTPANSSAACQMRGRPAGVPGGRPARRAGRRTARRSRRRWRQVGCVGHGAALTKARPSYANRHRGR